MAQSGYEAATLDLEISGADRIVVVILPVVLTACVVAALTVLAVHARRAALQRQWALTETLGVLARERETLETLEQTIDAYAQHLEHALARSNGDSPSRSEFRSRRDAASRRSHLRSARVHPTRRAGTYAPPLTNFLIPASGVHAVKPDVEWLEDPARVWVAEFKTTWYSPDLDPLAQAASYITHLVPYVPMAWAFHEFKHEFKTARRSDAWLDDASGRESRVEAPGSFALEALRYLKRGTTATWGTVRETA